MLGLGTPSTQLAHNLMNHLRPRPVGHAPHPRRREEAGFTLIEVLITVLVLTVGLLGTFAVVHSAADATANNRSLQAETGIARAVIEDAGALPIWQLTTSQLPSALQPLIPGATVASPGLQVTQGPSSYAVSLSGCSVDDPSDGFGVHNNPSQWCSNPAASTPPDPTPDDEERVSVTVSPVVAQPGLGSVQQTILIPNRPPVVSGVSVATGSCSSTVPPVSCTSAQPLTFTVVTATPVTSIRWFVNGDLQSTGDPYTTSGTSSQFSWQPPSGAARYTISAQAEYGQGPIGPPATLQVAITS